MTEHKPSLLDLHRTDCLLDQLAGRHTPDQTPMGDPVLRMLTGLIQAVDEVSIPSFVDMSEPQSASVAPSGPRVRRLAAAMAIAITLCSSGVATAAVSNPLRPIKAVVHHIYEMGRSGTPDSDGILGGLDTFDPPAHARSALEPSRSAASRDLPEAPGSVTRPAVVSVPKGPHPRAYGPEHALRGRGHSTDGHAQHHALNGQRHPAHHRAGGTGAAAR